MEKGARAYLNRREFMALLGVTGAAAVAGISLRPAKASAALETTRIRLAQETPACWAPQYVAEGLLRAEGFTDIEYIPFRGGAKLNASLRDGELDLALGFSGRQIQAVNPGDHTVFLSGLHAGCYSLLVADNIRSIRDLKGKTVRAGRWPGDGPHVFFATILAHVGLDPERDVNYTWVSKKEALQGFSEGKIDAHLSFAPEAQKLREKQVGRVLVDTNVDRPWSQYFCCMMIGNRDYVSKYPEATKRALRAILMGNDMCTQNPVMAADALINKKVRKPEERRYIIQAMKEIPYHKWRDFNPEDSIRYYALRLRELGLTKANPQEIIDRNTDWSFLEGLRGELGLTW